ncbi:MAG: MBL fold metallo-hydrolase [Clostridia bacterium]|nr:MBL fold metallo-hydrolase [Clostridia bacterium]
MLRIRFINVGDGDAILIEELSVGRAFRMLVDTGRAELSACADFLKSVGITHLDKLVITHLHADHIGGLTSLLGYVSVSELISGYIPLLPGAQAAPDPRADKSIRNMVACLNRFSADMAAMKADGTRMVELFASWHGVRLNGSLTADFIVPDVHALRLQREVWNHMLERRPVREAKKLEASKKRNPNSLRIRLRYAGREIELAGDCYAEMWEKGETVPCDIFKLPHHGSDRSVTDLLLSKLKPAHAVICCDRTADSGRPTQRTLDRLKKCGAAVWFTDGPDIKHSWSCADFAILDDGSIIQPTN